MFSGGGPAGFCGEPSRGPQLPSLLLQETRAGFRPPYCYGPCCQKHGGPAEGEPIVFQDGLTPEGRPMWCAVMPGFINLQESEAAFDGNPVRAVAKLRAALSQGDVSGEGEES
jgi:hypothetical protein